MLVYSVGIESVYHLPPTWQPPRPTLMFNLVSFELQQHSFAHDVLDEG